MGMRILGSPGSRRRRRFLLIPLLAMCAMASIYVTGALAVHDTGAFELDGNATNDPSVAGDDWDNVCHQVTGGDCSTTSNTNGATAVSWVSEPSRTTSIFTGGGSKDPQDISNWAWKNAGGLPDKDNLQHSFAARYSLAPSATCPAGTAATCDLLYFGSDRFDNSGDAQQGFWFFQNRVQQGSASSGGGFNFTGVHKNGDLLIISDFSNGGTTSTISVYTWDSSVNGNLRLLQTSTDANCATAASGDAFCGIVNPTDGTAAPWPFTDKSGNSTYLNGEFYEGGVNLSTLGLSGECFSSVASETRSSTSTTATLKDFVIGQFANCVPAMTTQASATVASPVLPGAAVTDTATITVTGGNSPADPTGDVTFYLCGPIATGDCGTSGGNLIGTGTLANQSGGTTTDGIAVAVSPTVNDSSQTGNRGTLAAGRYCFRATWPGDSNYPSALNTTNSTTECFAVKDTSTTTTAQNWLPNDTASVTLGSGGTVTGTVAFSLYESSDCSGTAVFTSSDSTAPFASSNTTVYTTAKTVSWRAVFTPSDSNAVGGSTSRCETTVVTTVNNNSGP